MSLIGVKILSYTDCDGMSYTLRFLQLFDGCFRQSVQRFKAFLQCETTFFSHSLNFVQHRFQRVFAVQLSEIGNGEPVRFVSDVYQQIESETVARKKNRLVVTQCVHQFFTLVRGRPCSFAIALMLFPASYSRMHCTLNSSV